MQCIAYLLISNRHFSYLLVSLLLLTLFSLERSRSMQILLAYANYYLLVPSKYLFLAYSNLALALQHLAKLIYYLLAAARVS
jgi:hypothetical protein